MSVSTNTSLTPILDLGEKGPSQQETPKTRQEKTTRQRLDIVLLPMMVLMLTFQYLDKGALGFAKINGIEKDLGITQRQFNAATSIWTVGYMIFQIPSNLIITRVHPGRYLSFWVAAWSVVGLCHAFVRNFGGLLAVRILLGVCDAPFLVGAIHLLSSWYTTKEMALRMSIVLGCLIITLSLTGPLSVGIFSGLGGKLGWKGWRWLYLCFGSGGLLVSALGFVLLPDYPNRGSKCWWLTREQTTLAIVRIEEDRIEEKVVERQKLWSGFKDAWKDGKTWLFIIAFTCRRSFDGIYIYFPSIIHSVAPKLIHTSKLSTVTVALLLTSPPALLAAIAAILIGYSSDRRLERCWHINFPYFFAIIGLVVSAAAVEPIARYAASFLYIPGSVAGNAMAWSWVASSLNETVEKRACAIAIIGVMSGFGGIWGPFLFRGRDRPRYLLAFLVLAGFGLLEIVCCFAVRRSLRKSNDRLKDAAEEHGVRREEVKLYPV